MSARRTPAEFIEKAKALHPDASYGYDRFVYIDFSTKGTIVCPAHGDFKQTPKDHLSGRGCRECGRKRTGSSRRSSLEEFITKAKGRHPDAGYQYGEFVYVTSATKGLITCPVLGHGDFGQTPNEHLMGSGCPTCGRKRTTAASTLTLEEFIAKAQERHPLAAYRFDKFVYTTSYTKGTVTCPLPGPWRFRTDPEQPLKRQRLPGLWT